MFDRRPFVLFLLLSLFLGVHTALIAGTNIVTEWYMLAHYSPVTLIPPVVPQGSGYTYMRTITIDHTKVPNTDQTNFPLLISGTYPYLATTSNGGNLQNANGYYVIFTSDSGCTTKLDEWARP